MNETQTHTLESPQTPPVNVTEGWKSQRHTRLTSERSGRERRWRLERSDDGGGVEEKLQTQV